MTVRELMDKLSMMPSMCEVYAEGEHADKVIYERCPDGGRGIVRIFKAWDMELTGTADCVARANNANKRE